MNRSRSLLTIFMMGILSMVALTMFGSFFMGKVGGAENVLGLQKELKQVFRAQMADEDALEVRIVAEGEESGLVLAYAVDPVLAKKDRSFKFHCRRVTQYVLGKSYWKRKARFVRLSIQLPGGRVHEEVRNNPKPARAD